MKVRLWIYACVFIICYVKTSSELSGRFEQMAVWVGLINRNSFEVFVFGLAYFLFVTFKLGFRCGIFSWHENFWVGESQAIRHNADSFGIVVDQYKTAS